MQRYGGLLSSVEMYFVLITTVSAKLLLLLLSLLLLKILVYRSNGAMPDQLVSVYPSLLGREGDGERGAGGGGGGGGKRGERGRMKGRGRA